MKKDNKSAIAILRERAEELLLKMSGKTTSQFSDVDALKLIHELEVHQIELEMQNEELILARYAAKEAAAKYMELYDFAPSGYVTLSKTNKILNLNHACARLLGKDRSHLINSDFRFFVTEDTLYEFNDFLHSAFVNNTKQTCEVALAASDRQPVYVSVEGVVSENGKECFVTIVDNTARKMRAMELLEKSYRQTNVILEAAGEGILGIDRNGKHTFINPMAVKLLGYQVEELLGKESHAVFHHHHQDGSEFPSGDCPIRDTYLTGKSHFGEDYFWRKDGTGFHVEFSSLPIMEDSRIAGAVITFRDITVRKQAVEALRESEERNKALLNANPDMMFLLDNDGVFIDYHGNNELSFYAPSDTFIGKNIAEVMPAEIAELTIIQLKQVLQSGLMQIYNYQLAHNGKITDFESRLVLCGNSKVLAIVRDITDRKQAERELIIAKEHAEESDRLKTAFLANMSHEIRTPMNGILGFAQLLLEPALSGEEKAEFIGIIEKNGARMLRVINDIIAISKIESGQMELSISETNVNEQIVYIYKLFKPEAAAKGLQFSYSYSLPFEEAFVVTDREKIYSVFGNLLNNAIKFTPAGSIHIGYLLKDANIEFFVKDSGIGIPVDRQEAVFERFIKADMSDKEAFQGAGLGLSISKAYVKMLGGKIRVESKEGNGSVFYFTIPYKREPDSKTAMPGDKPGS